jgi:hypothetical protein
LDDIPHYGRRISPNQTKSSIYVWDDMRGALLPNRPRLIWDRIYLEGGATLYASLDSRQFDPAPKSALIYSEDLHDIAIEGRVTIDGQASYEWRPNDFTDHYILANQRLMEATGKALMRPFPSGFPKETVYPRLVLLLRCDDVRIASSFCARAVGPSIRTRVSAW